MSTDSGPLLGTTTVQSYCLTSVLQLGSARWFILRKQCVYIIFGPGPWDFDSWLQARLSDAKVSRGEEKSNKESRREVLCNTFSLRLRGQTIRELEESL